MKYNEDDLTKSLGLDPNKPIPIDLNVPYFVHQEDISTLNIIHKRESTWKNIIIIILIILFAATNAGWIWYESQFEDVVTMTQDVDAESDGNSDMNLNTIGGDYYGGQSKSEANNNQN